MAKIHIGFDDIDSPYGGCTTHIVSEIIRRYYDRPWIDFIDYPCLIRLNPGVPWKTRGNGGVALHIKVPGIDYAYKLFDEVVGFVDEYIGEFYHPSSHPVISMILGEIPDRIKWLGYKAVQDIIPLDLVDRVIDKYRDRVRYHLFSKGRRGLIGSLASIGVTLDGVDYTYELIAYRRPDYWGRPRLVDPLSVREMDRVTKGYTFLNYDYEVDRPLITPHSPDPVLLGIRGEEPSVLVKAFKMLNIIEPVDMWVIYRTNQATDMHLRRIDSLSEAYVYTGVIARVHVSSRPTRIPGGHVVFRVSDGVREVDVAVYEPTGGFREIAYQLRPGDLVEVYGMVRPQSSRHGPTINLEKLLVLKLTREYRYEAPKCPHCGKRMKSMGKGKGYRCPKCGFRDSKAMKIALEVPRTLETGWYQPPPRAFKHLMKPIERFGREKKIAPHKLYTPWHSLNTSLN